MTLRTVIPYAPKEKSTGSEADIVDRTGSAILEFVKHAGETTETASKRQERPLSISQIGFEPQTIK
jgi:hypothetical protein